MVTGFLNVNFKTIQANIVIAIKIRLIVQPYVCFLYVLLIFIFGDYIWTENNIFGTMFANFRHF